MYNKTLIYRYYDLRQSILIWLEAKTEKMFLKHKKNKLLRHLYERYNGRSHKWFLKIADLIDESHGNQVQEELIEQYDKHYSLHGDYQQ